MDLTDNFFVLLRGLKFVSLCAGSPNIFGLLFQGPAQAQNLRDSLVEVKSDIVIKVCYSHVSPALDMELSFHRVLSENL